MNQATVTVCIPAYNEPEYLRQALASLCDQGLRRDEYVVSISDDASPTPLAPVAQRFADRLQVEYHRNDANVGHLANFARLFESVKTPLVSFLTHDDVIAPGQLGRALAAMKGEAGAVLVSSLALCQRYPGAPDTRLHGTFLRGSHASFSEPYVWDRTEWMALALTATPLSIVGSVFRAETFGRCTQWPRFPLWHDRLMLAEMGLHGTIISLPWVGGHYRVGAGQLSGRLWDTDRREFREVSQVVLDLCDAARIPVVDFWIDQMCTATPDDRITYLQMLNMALPSPGFAEIKRRSEQKLGTRLHLGGRLDRLGIPGPLADVVKGIDHWLASRRS